MSNEMHYLLVGSLGAFGGLLFATLAGIGLTSSLIIAAVASVLTVGFESTMEQ